MAVFYVMLLKIPCGQVLIVERAADIDMIHHAGVGIRARFWHGEAILRGLCASGHHDCQQQGTYDADVFHSLFLPHRIVAVARLGWRHGNQGFYLVSSAVMYTRLLTFALVIL